AGAGSRDCDGDFVARGLRQNPSNVFRSFRKHHARSVASGHIAGVGKIILNFVWLSLGQHSFTTEDTERKNNLATKKQKKHKRNYQKQACTALFPIVLMCIFVAASLAFSLCPLWLISSRHLQLSRAQILDSIAELGG